MAIAELRVIDDGAGRPRSAEVVGPLRLPQAGAADLRLIEHLRSTGIVEPAVLDRLLAEHLRDGAAVQDLLLAAEVLSEPALLAAMRGAYGGGQPPAPLHADARLVDLIGVDHCLGCNIAPLGRAGSAVILATARPAQAMRCARRIARIIGRFRLVLAPRAEVEAAILEVRRGLMAEGAEASVAAAESCRGWPERRMMRCGLAAAAVAAALLLVAPQAVLAALSLLAVSVLVANTALKAAAAIAALRRSRSEALDFAHRAAPQLPPHLPTVSILVPLFREREIAGRLVRRLTRLDYPRDRLEICLALEEDDFITREALARVSLPGWMHVVEVPRGAIKTKPRALNYALDFSRGRSSASMTPRMRRSPTSFAASSPASPRRRRPWSACRGCWISTTRPRTGCRGCSPSNTPPGSGWCCRGWSGWACRCRWAEPRCSFAATALLRLGGWDAHNVTEDADLGLRLARHGMRTELIATATFEEANCRALPWVRQRSRWLKGYAMTGFCHLRHPVRLWRDLGPWRFLGVVVMFPGTVLQYLLAPLLWSFWLGLFGHPASAGGCSGIGPCWRRCCCSPSPKRPISPWRSPASARSGHRGLGWWVPTMHLYFPLGTLAAWKGLIEIALRPYYWDKTTHGFSQPIRGDQPASILRASTRSRVS